MKDDGKQIKGSAILGALAWTSHHLGRDVRSTVSEALAEAWPSTFSQRLLASRWYPYAAYRDTLDVLASTVDGQGDGGSMHEIGLWTGERDLGGILRIVAIFSNPEAVVRRGFGSWGASYWSRFCSAGSVRLADCHATGAAIALDDFPDISSHHCRLMEGWWQAMAVAAGARGAKVGQSLCVHRGDACCEFRATWDA